MRDYGKIAPTFWTRGSGRKLRGYPIAQLVAVYLMTAPGSNLIGLYYVPIAQIANETGFTTADVDEALDRLSAVGIAFYDHENDMVWVPNMPRYQVGDALKNGDKRGFAVRKEVEAAGDHPFIWDFYRLYAVPFQIPRPRNVASLEIACRDLLGGVKTSPSTALRQGIRDLDQGTATPSEGMESDPDSPPIALQEGRQPVSLALLEGSLPNKARAGTNKEQKRGRDAGERAGLDSATEPAAATAAAGPESEQDEPTELERITAELASHPELGPIANGAAARAVHHRWETNAIAKGIKLEWVLEAIRECAADVAPLGLNAEAMSRKLRSYVDNARSPRPRSAKHPIAAPAAAQESIRERETREVQDREREAVLARLASSEARA